MSNELLLRLFTSEFFNSWIAVSYLFRYSNNVGIQHYLCTELRNFPLSEIEFFLPQLIHLLIFRPSESVALEHFLIEMCEKSTHMALMTLWYLQAYVSDLSADPFTSSFQLCKRLLNKSQAILFAADVSSAEHDNDGADETGHRVHFLHGGTYPLNDYNMIRENVFPTVVGMGAVLLGVGQPALTKLVGQIAIAQGRRRRDLLTLKEQQRNRIKKGTTSYSQPDLPIKRQILHPSATASTNSLQLDSNRLDADALGIASLKKTPIFATSSTEENSHCEKVRCEPKANGTPNYPLASNENGQQYLKSKSHGSIDQMKKKKVLNGCDPSLTALGQSSVPTNDASSSISPVLSYVSSPSSVLSLACTDSDPASICSSKRPSTSSLDQSIPSQSEIDDEWRNNKVDKCSQTHPQTIRHTRSHTEALLRSSHFRSEIQFVLALGDIATRLVIVPKEARMSALHAELTLLNHNLPADICLPLWCSCTASMNPPSKHLRQRGHHRIVRISPSDAVVLNSAERAPYLLTIEVLEDDCVDTEGYNSTLPRVQQERQAIEKKGKALKNVCKNEWMKMLDSEPSDSGSDHYGSSLVEKNNGSNRHTTELIEKPHAFQAQPRDDFAERTRTAAVMLAQLPTGRKYDPIRQKIIKEMMAFEQQRMANITGSSVVNSGSSRGDASQKTSASFEVQQQCDEAVVPWVENKDDPSAAVLSENWETKKERLRLASPYGHLPNWRLISVIVKDGADLRQEQFAIQLIKEMQRIWEDTDVDVWVKYYRVLVTSDSSGLIETLRNTISIHSLKKEAYRKGWHSNQKGDVYSLYDYFVKQWGQPDCEEFIKAQDAFMRSLAGYSIACYLLQIKDRHNGNLLIDDEGHLIHIDFGFMLSNSPGSVGFEMAPFKLPQEYIDILGGVDSEKFAEYRALLKLAFLAVRKHSENILLLTEMMCKDSKLPCFLNGDLTIPQLRDRFQLQLTEPQAEEFVDKLIMSSCCNVFTRLYDTFQYYSQGIL